MNLAVKPAPRLTLPAEWYHQADIFERERQFVFAREWQFIGPSSALANPGDYIATEITGWRVFVIKDRDGELRGFHNLCRHRAGHFLDDGQGHCDVLRCKYHGWVYDTKGQLRATPAFGEANWFDKKDYPLKPIKVATWRGLVFVNLDLDSAPLEKWLGDLPSLTEPYPMEDFTCLKEVQFDISCNWKTYTDNFVEGYHIPSIHAGLNAAIDFAAFETTYGDNVVIMKAPQRTNSIYGGIWLRAYPNMTLSVYPNGMNTSRILPIDPKRAKLIYHFYFPDGSEAAARQRTIETNCQIVREDFGICEVAQRNLEAGAFSQGPLSPKQEAGVGYFHDRLRTSLEQDRIRLKQPDP